MEEKSQTLLSVSHNGESEIFGQQQPVQHRPRHPESTLPHYDDQTSVKPTNDLDHKCSAPPSCSSNNKNCSDDSDDESGEIMKNFDLKKAIEARETSLVEYATDGHQKFAGQQFGWTDDDDAGGGLGGCLLPPPPPPPKRRRSSTERMGLGAAASTSIEVQNANEEPKYARVNLGSKRNSRNSEPRNGTPRRTRRQFAVVDRSGVGERESLLASPRDSTPSDVAPIGFDRSAVVILSSDANGNGGSRRRSTTNIILPSEDINPDCIKAWQKKSCDALQAVVTALYCKILVILGLAFPMAEVISDSVPQGYYQLFYVYLFLGSLVFLLFIYVDLMRTRSRERALLSAVAANHKKSKCEQADEDDEDEDKKDSRSSSSDSSSSSCSNKGENLVPRPRVHYGSFYLRLGAVLFGIGSMIYSGIEIGMFFELNLDEAADCKNLFSILRPILQMAFVFVQMYFVFLNQKMNIYKNKFLSRFGLMHMIATNLCVWLNVLILETSHEIHESHLRRHLRTNEEGSLEKAIVTAADDGATGGGEITQYEDKGFGTLFSEVEGNGASGGNLSLSSYSALLSHFDSSHLISLCHRKRNIMSKLLSDSGPFLFPCTIEYSLICAAVLFVMWKNIAEEHDYYKFQKRRNKITAAMQLSGSGGAAGLRGRNGGGVGIGGIMGGHGVTGKSVHHYSVDCTHANTGLFVGIFVMVLTIISLIVFFVLISSPDTSLHSAAITVASLTELILYCVTTVAVVVGMVQVRSLWYDTSRKLELDNLLLVVAQTGVFIYAAFCIIGSFFQLQEHLLAFLASLATLMQTTMQTVFILDASSRFAYCSEQVKHKPGREVVTFLLVCNLAMWAINTLETNRADSHPIQVKFYGGDWAWPIITHISMPLAIFYRFHSTVCLCEIWKKSFKYKSSNMAYV